MSRKIHMTYLNTDWYKVETRPPEACHIPSTRGSVASAHSKHLRHPVWGVHRHCKLDYTGGSKKLSPKETTGHISEMHRDHRRIKYLDALPRPLNHL